MTREQEIQYKLGLMRAELQRQGASALRLKGNDWLFWAAAGADNTVLLASETGVAEILVTAQDAWILTDEIEAERLSTEQSAPGYQLQIRAWADAGHDEAFVAKVSAGRAVLCDRPANTEGRVSATLRQQRLQLSPSEISRYKEIGSLAASAMTEVLSLAKPTWSELE